MSWLSTILASVFKLIIIIEFSTIVFKILGCYITVRGLHELQTDHWGWLLLDEQRVVCARQVARDEDEDEKSSRWLCWRVCHQMALSIGLQSPRVIDRLRKACNDQQPASTRQLWNNSDGVSANDDFELETRGCMTCGVTYRLLPQLLDLFDSCHRLTIWDAQCKSFEDN